MKLWHSLALFAVFYTCAQVISSRSPVDGQPFPAHRTEKARQKRARIDALRVNEMARLGLTPSADPPRLPSGGPSRLPDTEEVRAYFDSLSPGGWEHFDWMVRLNAFMATSCPELKGRRFSASYAYAFRLDQKTRQAIPDGTKVFWGASRALGADDADLGAFEPCLRAFFMNPRNAFHLYEAEGVPSDTVFVWHNGFTFPATDDPVYERIEDAEARWSTAPARAVRWVKTTVWELSREL